MRLSDKQILFLAQGFGVGRIRCAPGTWGSLVGFGYFLLLIATNEPGLVLVVPFVGVLAAVWICGRAARILGEEDPPSVVLDEIVAVPFCMVAMVILLNDLMGVVVKPLVMWLGMCAESRASAPVLYNTGAPRVTMAGIFFGMCYSPILLGFVFLHFLLFRLFDIWKPWPVRQSQRLPGGWGIVVDDLLAAVYVNATVVAVWWVIRLF